MYALLSSIFVNNLCFNLPFYIEIAYSEVETFFYNKLYAMAIFSDIIIEW